jgi:hypothetical protein
MALGSVTTDGTTITFRPIARQHGTTTFTYTLSDGHGQHATATVTVTVVPVYDPNSPPVCATAYGGEIWPPNPTQFFSAPVNGVTDPDGDPLTLTILTVTQDEPVDTTGDGRFSPDVQIQNSGQETTVWVRGERDGKGDGRVYEIHFTATDPFGEMCTSSVFWTVPKNQGQPLQVIDSGSRYGTLVVVPAARSKP